MDQSAWRLGDAAAFAEAMATADELLALLLATAREDPSKADAMREEASEVRVARTVTDGFDRSAVEAQRDAWIARLRELRGVA